MQKNSQKIFDKKIVSISALGAALTIISYLFFDKPIAYFMHSLKPPFAAILNDGTLLEKPIFYLAIVFTVLAMFVHKKSWLKKEKEHIISCGFSIVLAYATCEFLKVFFGRFWPETWINNNPSLIGNGAFGFNFLHGGHGFASFPSGHMTIFTALATSLILSYKRLTYVWILIPIFMATCLLLLDYHFLSDIIAGSTLGAVTAILVKNHINAFATSRL